MLTLLLFKNFHNQLLFFLFLFSFQKKNSLISFHKTHLYILKTETEVSFFSFSVFEFTFTA